MRVKDALELIYIEKVEELYRMYENVEKAYVKEKKKRIKKAYEFAIKYFEDVLDQRI